MTKTQANNDLFEWQVKWMNSCEEIRREYSQKLEKEKTRSADLETQFNVKFNLMKTMFDEQLAKNKARNHEIDRLQQKLQKYRGKNRKQK